MGKNALSCPCPHPGNILISSLRQNTRDENEISYDALKQGEVTPCLKLNIKKKKKRRKNSNVAEILLRSEGQTADRDRG